MAVWAAAAALALLAAAGGGAAQPAPAAEAASLEQLCGPAPASTVAANGLPSQVPGPLQRLNTTTASWGYYRFGNTSSPRPLLIMLAGFGSTVSAWPRDLLETLAEDQEVIIVDNRGQGNTIDFEPLEPLSIPGLANDTWEFIEALELEDPPNVLGWSMGGMLSVSLAALHGEQLGKIVSLAGSAGGQEATPPTDRATAILLGLNGATERDSLSNLFPLDNAEGVEAACQFVNSERGVPGSKANDTTTTRQLSAVVNYLLFDDTTWDLLPGVENAVLLAAGTLDPVVQLANSRVMVERLQNPWLVTFPGAHAFFLQHMPAFLEVLDVFLSEF